MNEKDNLESISQAVLKLVSETFLERLNSIEENISTITKRLNKVESELNLQDTSKEEIASIPKKKDKKNDLLDALRVIDS